MNRKIILITPVIVLLLIIILLIAMNFKSVKLDFNSKLELSFRDTKIDHQLAKMTNEEFAIDEQKINNELNVDKAIELAHDITNAFNDIENDKYIYNIKKYTLRKPSLKVSDVFLDNADCQEWQDNNMGIESLAYFLQAHSYKFEKISDYNITHSSDKSFLIEISIDNFSNTSSTFDAIFEYEIVYEDSSNMYKVKSIAVEWVNDLENYYRKVDNSERLQNNINSNPLSNVLKYLPENFTNFNYTKLRSLNNKSIDFIYNKNKNGVVIIDSVSERGIPTGNASGFFIRSGILMTSYDSVYSMLENGAVRFYAVDNDDKTYEVDGVVAAYPSYNVIILKLKDEIGTPIVIGDSAKIEKNDPIAVISSTIGLKLSIKLGIYFDTLDDNYKIIRTSLPLKNGDSGSAIFNSNGEVIGMNTKALTDDDKLKSGFNNAIDISLFKNVINKIKNKNFKDIDYSKFSYFNKKDQFTSNNTISNRLWKKYEKLPIITNFFPLELYSAYQKDNYLIIRYKQDLSDKNIDNDIIINTYIKYLTDNSYEKISDDVYQKDGITFRINNNLGFIIVVVEGVV